MPRMQGLSLTAERAFAFGSTLPTNQNKLLRSAARYLRTRAQLFDVREHAFALGSALRTNQSVLFHVGARFLRARARF